MWQIICNKTTCKSGRKKWETFLLENNIPHKLYATSTVSEARSIMSVLYRDGHRHYLLMGGDGTVHHGGNILMELAGAKSPEITIGVLPCGTGNDWVRVFGVPEDRLAESLLSGKSVPFHVLEIKWPDGQVKYAMNMVGGGLDAAVVAILRNRPNKVPAKIIYPVGLAKALLRPHIWHADVQWEGGRYSGPLLTVLAGFSPYCGGGMKPLPHALPEKPALLIMRPKSLMQILRSSPGIYSGNIIHEPEAITGHFEEIEINHFSGTPIPLEADGELLRECPATIKALFGAMQRLV